jgi:HEAT repeats
MRPARAVLLALFACTALAAAFSETIAGILLQLKGAPLIASSGALSEHDLDEINAMSPQDQAERLLEKVINHYSGAGEEIAKRVDGWRGQIKGTPELEKLTNTAYFSSDLRVRAAALEIWLARDGLAKTSETVDQLIAKAASSDNKWFALSSLGILGNRGVERQKVFDTLMLYVHDPDASARSSAINGLGLLGTENTVAPLLEIFRNDSSPDLRERAACNLADSGMLDRDSRQKAVPELIRFSRDPAMDEMTRKWVYQALREITGRRIANDPAAWAAWFASR